MDIATRAVDRLTGNVAGQLAQDPSWSGEGKIVFSEAASGDELPKLFLINPDGSGRRGLPAKSGGRHLLQPNWAPDGRQLAVARLGSGIYVVQPRSGSTRLLEATGETDEAPVWSPDGKEIAFQRQMKIATNIELYRVDPAGGGLRRVTRDPRQQINPTWSADGSRLAFAELRPTGRWAILSMSLDGSDRRLLTDQRFSSQDPAWSPDGKKIAFVLQDGSRESIAVIDAAGGKARRITPPTLIQAATPSWSPDSEKIIFAARSAARPPPTRGPGS
jgi:Tol biopolymer transport system component